MCNTSCNTFYTDPSCHCKNRPWAKCVNKLCSSGRSRRVNKTTSWNAFRDPQWESHCSFCSCDLRGYPSQSIQGPLRLTNLLHLWTAYRRCKPTCIRGLSTCDSSEPRVLYTAVCHGSYHLIPRTLNVSTKCARCADNTQLHAVIPLMLVRVHALPHCML